MATRTLPHASPVARARRARAARAARCCAATEEGTYEVNIEKPLGVKFGRGNDGGAYVVSVSADPRFAQFTVGDKILEVSASFGPEVWKAENYGQVVFAIKTRSGGVYLKMKANNGDMSAFDALENSAFKTERNGGNYGAGTQELQRRNYVERKELEKKRTALFAEALEYFEAKDYQAALIVFEEIAGLEPPNFIGDNFEKVTRIYTISQYNIACCYSLLGSVDAALEALQICLSVGWEDFAKVRTDPSLKAVQASPKFKPLMDKYDEPFLNEGALKAFNAFAGLFGGKK